MENKRRNSLAKNTIILAIGVFFPKLAVFITLPILTGCLTKVEYGTYDLILTLVSLLLPAATLQIQTAAFRFLIEMRGKNKEIKSIVTTIYLFILPTSLIVLTVLYFILANQSVVLRVEICAYFMLDIICGTTRQVTRGFGKNSEFAASAFVSAVVQIAGVGILVGILQRGLEGALLALCAGEFFAFSFLTFKIKLWNYFDRKLASKDQLKSLLSYSWPMVPNSLSMWVMRVSDRFVITAVMGVAANAVYAVAYKIPSILNLAQSTFNMAWQESASLATKDADADTFYSNTFRQVYDLSAGFLSFLIGITPVLFTILIRGDYAEAYNQILVLYLAVFLFVLSTFWGGLYVAYRRTKSVGVTAVLAAIINFVVDIALIKWIGLYAASGSTLVSYLFLCVFRFFDTKKFLNIHYDFKHILGVLLIVIVQCVMCAQRKTVLDMISFAVGVSLCIALNRTLIVSYWKKFFRAIKTHLGHKGDRG